MRKAIIPALLIPLLAGIAGARGQGLTESDRDFLLALHPAAEEALLSVEQLAAASADLSKAASAGKDCAMDRVMIAFGAGLQNASTALKWLEPMLLKQTPVGPGALVSPSPAEVQALQANLQRHMTYLASLDKVAEAGKLLSSLDPIGSAGPPVQAGALIRDAGQALMAEGEQSGIGVHLTVSGGSVEAFRRAMLRLDGAGCGQAASAMAQTAGLIAASLGFSRGILWQSDAAKGLAGALLDLSQQMPAPPLDELDRAIALYANCLMEQSHALRRQSEIALAFAAPAALADAAAKYRGAAGMLAENAAKLERIAGRIDDARRALAGAPAASGTSSAARLRAAGATLDTYGVWYTVIATGEAMIRAGELIDDGRAPAAAAVLTETAKKIVRAEKRLALEKL